MFVWSRWEANGGFASNLDQTNMPALHAFHASVVSSVNSDSRGGNLSSAVEVADVVLEDLGEGMAAIKQGAQRPGHAWLDRQRHLARTAAHSFWSSFQVRAWQYLQIWSGLPR
jgi:hypothetical protein